jgi:hypothetical protein
MNLGILILIKKVFFNQKKFIFLIVIIIMSMFENILYDIIPNIIKIGGLSYSGYNIVNILLKENLKNDIIKYYKNKFSLNNNIEMENKTDSDSDDYEEFINKVDQIKSNTFEKSENQEINKTEECKTNVKQDNLINNEKNEVNLNKEEKNEEVKDNIFIKKKKKVRQILDPERQMEDLDNLFRKKMLGKLSSEEEKEKVYKDDLKRISKNFERDVVENSLRGFSVDKQLFILDLNKLTDNIKGFDSEKFVCEILYKMYNRWYIINKMENKIMTDDNKLLKICLKIFEKNDKFRKKINDIHFRCIKKNYIQYKTSNDIELILVTKFKERKNKTPKNNINKNN